MDPRAQQVGWCGAHFCGAHFGEVLIFVRYTFSRSGPPAAPRMTLEEVTKGRKRLPKFGFSHVFRVGLRGRWLHGPEGFLQREVCCLQVCCHLL